jgi:hypothetical protein
VVVALLTSLARWSCDPSLLARAPLERGGEVDGMSPWRDRVAAERNRASLSPRAARQRKRLRSFDQVIKIAEESDLAPEEQKQAAKLRRLLNDLDLSETPESEA